MQVQTYNVSNPNARVELNLGKHIQQALARTDQVLARVKNVMPEGFQAGPDKVGVASLNHVRSFERLSYHRARACADVLGDEQGVWLWKEVIERVLQDEKAAYERARQERTARSK